MSTFRAIATVTAALQARLQDVVHTELPGASVTALRPAEPGASGIPAVGVNIFLYQAHINPALRNRDAPTRAASGALLQQPVVPVDLDYMVSFYGDQNLQAHLLLGLVLRSLNARPVLTPAMITAVDPAPGSGLAAQSERVVLTPLVLSIEEMSRLWSVFFQTSYVLSVAYRASVVLIEAGTAPTRGPPVLTPAVAAALLPQPTIAAVVPASGDPAAPITAGAAVAILGERLGDTAVVVIVGGREVVPDSIASTRIVLRLPADLPAGAQGLRVRQDVPMGSPPSPRPGTLSPLASLVVAPEIAQAGGAYQVSVAGVSDAPGPRSATVSATLTAPVQPGQAVLVQLLDQTLAVQAVASPPPAASASSAVAAAVSGVPPGTYVVRVTVDGADSPVVRDAAPGSRTAGQLVPQVAVP